MEDYWFVQNPAAAAAATATTTTLFVTMITLFYMEAYFVFTNTNNRYAKLLNLESSEEFSNVGERAGIKLLGTSHSRPYNAAVRGLLSHESFVC